MNRRWLYGVLAVLAISLLVSSGSFSSVSADRGMNVAVADDASAFVGYDTTCANNEFAVTVTNRFESTLTDGSVTVGETTTSLGELGPGEAAVATFDTFEAGDPVTVDLQGPTKTVQLDRSVPLDCQPPQERDVRFPGDSDTVVIQVEDATGTYWTLDEQSEQFELTSGNRLQNSSSQIVAVYLESTDITYVHPGLTAENGSYVIEGGQGSTDLCRYEGKVPLSAVDLDAC